MRACRPQAVHSQFAHPFRAARGLRTAVCSRTASSRRACCPSCCTARWAALLRAMLSTSAEQSARCLCDQNLDCPVVEKDWHLKARTAGCFVLMGMARDGRFGLDIFQGSDTKVTGYQIPCVRGIPICAGLKSWCQDAGWIGSFSPGEQFF